jgi:predicted metalloprotease
LPPPQAYGTGHFVPQPQQPIPRAPYPAPQFQQYPMLPPKKSKAPLVLGLIAVGAVILGVIGVAAVGTTKNRVADANYSTYTPAPDTPTEDSSTPSTPTNGKAVLKLADNPLFSKSQSLHAIVCKLPQWQNNPTSASAYFQAALSCLNNAWKPVLTSLNLPFSPPHLQTPATGAGQSECVSGADGDNFAAYYCPRDQQLVMPYTKLQVDEFGAHPGVYLAVFAHEYGHHIQQLTGISDAADTAMYDSGASNDKSLELNRRLELQAQCFSGLFFADGSKGAGTSITARNVNEGMSTQERGDQDGEPRTHGTSAHTSAWWSHGYKTGNLQQCNTWAATSTSVA